MFGIVSGSLAYLFARRTICQKTASASFSQSGTRMYNHAVDCCPADMQRLHWNCFSVLFQICKVLKQNEIVPFRQRSPHMKQLFRFILTVRTA